MALQTIQMLETRPIGFRVVADRPDLLADHYEELATDKERMVLAPDLERYAALESAGLLLGLGLFGHGELVGYSVGFVHTSMHYKALVQYENDVVFLAKAYRNAGVGKQLIDATEAEAKARGAVMILWHAKPATPLHALLSLLGYGVQDVIFGKGV